MNKDELLEHSSDIFRYYFGNYKLKKYYKSPFRNEENPSFNIFIGRGGIPLYKDFGNSSGNAIDFVVNKYSITFKEAIDKIAKDLNIKDKTKNNNQNSSLGINIKNIEESKSEVRESFLNPIYYEYNGRPIYTKYDLEYWLKDLKIGNINLLLKHNILSARELLIKGARVWSAFYGNPIYIYLEEYNGVVYKKAYRPKGEKNNKWRSDYVNIERMIHNIKNIDYRAKDLIITKSNKDCVVLDSLGFNSVNTQGEDIEIPTDIINYLKRYFNIFILYDCDYDKDVNIGYELSNKHSLKHKVNQIIIPESYEVTDIAELITKFNRELTRTLINKWKK